MPVAGLALAALLAPVVGGGGVASAETTIYRLNAGGGQLAGSPPWSPDTPFVSGSALSTYSTSASITLDPSVQSVPAALFQTERWSADDGQPMTYHLPASSGSYRVNLYFAEIWPGAFTSGARQFNVDLNGKRVLTHYDIFAEVGANRGTVKTFDVTTSDGIDVVLTHVAGRNNPKISGLSVVQLGSTTTTTTQRHNSTTSTTVRRPRRPGPPPTTTHGHADYDDHGPAADYDDDRSWIVELHELPRTRDDLDRWLVHRLLVVEQPEHASSERDDVVAGHDRQLRHPVQGSRHPTRSRRTTHRANSSITILNPDVAGVVKSRWIYAPSFANVRRSRTTT